MLPEIKSIEKRIYARPTSYQQNKLGLDLILQAGTT